MRVHNPNTLDPVVLTHAHALLKGDGVTAVQEDLTRPSEILRHEAVSPVLKPGEPLGVVLAMVLHFASAETARHVTGVLAGALAPGSCLVVSVGSGDEEVGGKLASEYQAATAYNHSPADIASFLDGFELQPPGLTDARDWRPGGPQ